MKSSNIKAFAISIINCTKSFLILLLTLSISTPLASAEWNNHCVDFEEMAPIMSFSSSETNVSSREGDGYLCLATDGAVLVYRSSAERALQATRLIDGVPLWIFKTGGEINSRPLISDGMVFFGSDDGFLYAVDEKVGNLLWKFDARQPKSTLKKAAEKGKSLFGNINLKDIVDTKREITAEELQPTPLRSRPAVTKDVLAMYVPEDKIVGLSYETGEKLWETNFPERGQLKISSLFPEYASTISINEITSDGEEFFIGYGSVMSFDPITGASRFLWPEPGEKTTGFVRHIEVTSDRVIAALSEGGIAAIGKKGEGTLWYIEATHLPGIYQRIYIDDNEGFALVKDKGVICFTVDDGHVKWIGERAGSDRLWIGKERVYLIYDGHHILALDRKTGAGSWEKDFARCHVSKLYDCLGALLFGSVDGHSKIRVCSTELPAIWAMITYGYSFDEEHPAATVRRALKSGYPFYYLQTEQARFGVFTPEASRALIRQTLDEKSYPIFGSWYLQLEEVQGDSAAVTVATTKVEEYIDGMKHPLLNPEWHTLQFHLIRENGDWLISDPLPESCEIDTSCRHPVFGDTPGIQQHPSGVCRTPWPLALTPEDHWEYEVRMNEMKL
jgi:outer membrane protein assembly factor BamB